MTAAVWACPVEAHEFPAVPGRPTVEVDDGIATCLYPGCLRSSDDPDRRGCVCEEYDCAGGCCGGECSCNPMWEAS